ncbi:MAG: hypothetical protein J7494_11770 [Sphingobium sp.]|nr:hypothetical protein [Sphingobium sp.]
MRLAIANFAAIAVGHRAAWMKRRFRNRIHVIGQEQHLACFIKDPARIVLDE